ncbi:hypothetical protein K461DRAFT_279661 [Myriangium duriaei CBS 260.36]|uniref:Uncharacterized protein n=1 Tax=Myriangium duriaei CBS 260.36 TaxID=1168546 RepID=A0A9P4MLW5_9PEZI|nr:hypothetical protein K461DRAFT_279661 [Myriangium duriaei CBS 260.36]
MSPSSVHAWDSLPSALQMAIPKVNNVANSDGQMKAFTTSDAITKSATFGIKAAGSSEVLLVQVDNGKIELNTALDAVDRSQ